jgi:hypothetical protein
MKLLSPIPHSLYSPAYEVPLDPFGLDSKKQMVARATEADYGIHNKHYAAPCIEPRDLRRGRCLRSERFPYLTVMSEEDDPLARNGNWRRLSISFDNPRAMEQMGPNLEVSIAAVTEQGTTLAHHEVGALIDTGSKSSCISPRLAPKMEGGLRGVRSLSHIYGLLEGPPTIRGLVRFKNGVAFIRDFSVLDDLAPYDVLIGRDILREGRMYIDGGSGHFRLYFPDRTT